jgi:Periplasmic copper-binding protein (NosD)
MDLPLRWTLGGISLVSFALALGGLVAFGAGQASASHVSCGDVITENTRLDSDLDCFDSDGPALVIGADRVRLDLGGHRIQLGFGIGVLNEGHERVTIANGEVFTGCNAAILLRGADRNRLRDLVALSGCEGVVLEGSDRNRLVRSRFGGDDGGLILRDGSDRNLITRNELGGGLGGGLSIRDSDGNLATRNFGFGFPSLAPGLGVGPGSDDTTLRRNLVVQGGARDGILVAAETTGTRVERNQVRGYDGDGIHVDSPFTTLTRNSSNDNGGWGILAVPGVTDGGGNTASGNLLGQCLNVSC